MAHELQRLTERIVAPFSGAGIRVDRDKGIIFDVLLCGFESDNGRTYPWGKGLAHRKGTYEGRGGNFGHNPKSPEEARICWYENERTDEQGRPRADMHVLKSHPMAERVLEAAERKAPTYGLSHVAMCKTRPDGRGGLIVESVESVETVDVVADPATTHSFHESRSNRVKTTIKKLLEKLAAKSNVDQILRLKRLSEDFGDMEMDAPADDVSSDDGISAAFKQAIMSVIDGAMAGGGDAKTALKKIKKLLDSHADVNGTETETDGIDPKTEEGKKKPVETEGNRILEALDVVEKLKFKADKADLEIIAATPAASRERVAKRLMESGSSKGDGTGPRSAPRGAGATALAESTKTAEACWLD